MVILFYVVMEPGNVISSPREEENKEISYSQQQDIVYSKSQICLIVFLVFSSMLSSLTSVRIWIGSRREGRQRDRPQGESPELEQLQVRRSEETASC